MIRVKRLLLAGLLGLCLPAGVALAEHDEGDEGCEVYEEEVEEVEYAEVGRRGYDDDRYRRSTRDGGWRRRDCDEGGEEVVYYRGGHCRIRHHFFDRDYDDDDYRYERRRVYRRYCDED